MIDSSELLAFVRTVDAKSLSRAARDLAIPRATISRRLARLEEQLGVRLLRRSTRSLVLTDAGDAFYRHARIALDAVVQAEASVRTSDSAIRGDLRISVPPIVSASFHELLSAFAAAHPEVRLQVHFASQHVDLRRDGFDVAIRASQTLEPGLVARTLVRMTMLAVASPGYLAKHGTPRGVRDLRRHRLLVGFERGLSPQTSWPLLKGGRVHVDAAMSTNEISLLGYAAARGEGIAVVPRVLVDTLLADGALVHVLPDVLGADSRLSVVYAERELMPAPLRAFLDVVATWKPNLLVAMPAAEIVRAAVAPAASPRRGSSRRSRSP